MNYRNAAQRICQMIDSASSSMSDAKRYNTWAGLDIWLDGTSYEAELMPGEYDGGEPQIVEVELENLAFPCLKFSVENGVAMFECVDPTETSFQPVSVGQIEDTLREAGMKTVDKAVVKIHTGDKVEVATVVGCEDHIIHWSQFGKNDKPMLAAGYADLDKVLDLDYSPAIQKIAQDDFSTEMQFSESMKNLGKRFFNEEESEFHEYRVSFVVKGKTAAQHLDVTASTIEDAMKSFNEKMADEFPREKVTKVTNITRDGKLVTKKMLDTVNSSLLDECDGGAAAGGDGGGAAPGGGDASGADAGSIGDTAAEMAGTTTTEVLGKCEPGKGYMGKDNFYIPTRARVPLHRWEAANGGSKRKKKGKYPYEKGMKVVVSMFEEDEEMLNEFEDRYSSYEYLSGKDWDEIVDAANERARKNGKPPKLPEYERWEAAQLPPPDEQTHGTLSGCTIDEDSFAKKQYLKEFFIHGIYKDGKMFELGPMKRKVASEYLNLHSLTVNKRAFQQMADDNFSGIRTIGDYNGNRPLHIAKLKDGFWLIDAQSIFKAGPFSNKQLARMYALKNGLEMEKGAVKDKAEEGYRLEYPTFAFSYKMAGIPCMDIVVAEDLGRAMKRFDTQWRSFDNSRSTRDKFNSIQDLQRDLSLLFIKDIEIEELTPDNVDEYVELADATGNPSTIPELQHRCKNPKFQYILGNTGKTGRLVIQPFTEADEFFLP